MKALLDFLDNRAVIRRIVLFVTLWMTWRGFEWAGQFASTTPKSGLEVAAIITAVTAPVAALQAAVFKVYSSSRG